MTKEEAIKYLIKPVVTSTEIGEEKQKEFEAYNLAISALSEPIKVITDDTIEVRYTDFENIKRIILTNGDIFRKMFYEDNTQDDDSDYDSLVPDEYKTEPSDLISRDALMKQLDERYCKPCQSRREDYNGVRCRACWVDDAVGEIEDAPSAEPMRSRCEVDAKSDLISRADAIEAIPCGLCYDKSNCVKAIEELPSADRHITSGYIADDKEVPPYTTTSAVSAEPSVEIKECKPLCTEQKIAVEEFLNAPRITEECAIELLQMTGWLQEHDKEIGRPSGEWIFDTEIPIGDGRTSAGYRCSVCGADFFQISERANYCMVCGARMENKE